MLRLNKETNRGSNAAFANKHKGDFPPAAEAVCVPSQPRLVTSTKRGGWRYAPWPCCSATNWINHFFNSYPAKPLKNTDSTRQTNTPTAPPPPLWYFNPRSSTGGSGAALLRERSTPLIEKKSSDLHLRTDPCHLPIHICLHCFIVMLAKWRSASWFSLVNIG